MDEFETKLDAVFAVIVPQTQVQTQKPKAIWVDFDGTLTSDPPSRDPLCQAPREDVVGAIRQLKQQCLALNVIVFTARPWADMMGIKEWLDAHCVPYDSVVCGKPSVNACIDNISVNPCLPGWQQQLNHLLGL
jgi:hypothetical protein